MCLHWREPPRAKNEGGVVLHAEAEGLKGRPGAWARIAEMPLAVDAAHAADMIRRALYGAFKPAGAFEAKARTENGRYFVYARYVGGAERN